MYFIISIMIINMHGLKFNKEFKNSTILHGFAIKIVKRRIKHTLCGVEIKIFLT